MNNIFDITDYTIPKFNVKTNYIYRYNKFDEEKDIIDKSQNDTSINLVNDNKEQAAIKIQIEFLENISGSDTHSSYYNLYNKMKNEVKTKLANFANKNILTSETLEQNIADINYFNDPFFFEDSINSYVTSQNKKKSLSVLNAYNVSSSNLFNGIDSTKEYSVSNKYIKDVFNNKTYNLFSNEINLYSFFTKFSNTEVLNDLAVELDIIGTKLNFEENLDQFKITTPKENIEYSDETVIFNKFKNFYLDVITENSLQSNQETCGSIFVGFLIKKHIKRKNGEYLLNASANFIYLDYLNIITNNKMTFFDTNVKYGNQYSYEIIPVFYLSLNNTTNFFPERYHYLICQNSFLCDFLSTVDYNQPNPPNSLRAKYLYNKKKVLLEWDYPNWTNNDIVGYHIYKRKDINEPYSLVKVFMRKEPNMFLNFDNLSDIIDDSYLEISDTNYLHSSMEDEMDLSAGFSNIYAVCAVNAHGIVSNFSNQIAVRYSIVYNKIIIDNISFSNAPRQYPNLYIQRKSILFENDNLLFNFTPFFKNKEKIKIYFTPDCYSLQKNNESNNNNKIIVSDFSNVDYHLNLTRLTDLQTKNILFNFKTNSN